jgi:superfamily II DNA or RNA helicase
MDPGVIYRSASSRIEDGWGEGDHSQQQAELQAAYDSLERVVSAAKEACTNDSVGVAVLFEIGRKAINTKPTTPFSAWLEPRTITRYTTVWKRILGYIFRTIDLPDDDQPPYVISTQQDHAFARLRRNLRRTAVLDAEAHNQAIDRTMLDFLVSLLDQYLPSNAYDSVLLSALAAMGVRADGGWVQPENYTGYYSAVVKIARMAVVRQAEVEDQEAGETFEIFPIVRDKVRRFMTLTHDGVLPTPMDWIFDARTYGLKIRFTTAAAGHISWSGTTVTYRTVSFSMEALSEMLHGLVSELSRTMDELTFAAEGLQLPPLPLEQLYDDMSNDKVGFSFARDPRNSCLVGLDRWLVRQVSANLRLRNRFFRCGSEGEGHLRADRAEAYVRLVDEFRKLLLVITHLLSGQPARTTEILSMRHANTPYGGVRNVFLQGKMLCLVAFYHKGYSLHGQVKVVHRYLPKEVGVLFVRYLTIVLPFAQQLLIEVGVGTELSPFLWESALVRAATTRTAEKSSPNLWSPDRMRRVLQGFAERYMGTPLTISSWRHLAIAIGRRYLQGILKTGASDDSYGDSDTEDEEQIPDNILDVQATHSTHISETIYARTIFQGGIGIGVRQEEFQKASQMWHSFLGFGLSDKHLRQKPKVELFDKERHTVRQKRLKRLQAVDLLGQFRQLVRRPDAAFRGNQARALQAVVRGHTPILQVAGTGEGKSFTFLVPSYAAPDGTTIVLVPFLALQDDLHDRIRTMDISCGVWPCEGLYDASIILVTPESFCTKAFREFLNRLVGRHQLDRIVFDECHVVLDSSYEFRPRIRTIGEAVFSAGVQLVFLTATMPPRDEAEFWTTLRIPPSKALVVRGSTGRPNITYRVKLYASAHDRDMAVADLVRRAGPGNRTIVYCQSKQRTMEVAELLGCAAYHSEAGPKAEKSAIVHGWKDHGGAIVATSALGVGLDVADVRFVMHVDVPRSLRDFAQESGRGGRDGLSSRSTVFAVRPRTKPVLAVQGSGNEDIGEYVFGHSLYGCRRTILARVLDGHMDRTGCQDGERICDVCFVRQRDAARQAEAMDVDGPDEAVRVGELLARDVRSRGQETAQQLQEFVQGLRRFATACFFCQATGQGRYDEHSFRECRLGEEGPVRVRTTMSRIWGFHGQLRNAVRRKKLGSYNGCFRCGVPQKFCDRWEPDGADEGSFRYVQGAACTYDDVLYQVVSIAIICKQETEGRCTAIRVVRGMGVWVSDDISVEDFAVTGVRWGGVQTVGLCVLFWAIVREFI